MLTSDMEQEKRWAEHSEEVINRENQIGLPDILEEQDDLDINIERPTKEEIVNAINELKNEKAPGHD